MDFLEPYKSLKTALKSEINEDARATLNSDTSRPFPRPNSLLKKGGLVTRREWLGSRRPSAGHG